MIKRLLLTLTVIYASSGCALFMGPGHDQTSKVAVTQSALRYLYPDDQLAGLSKAQVTNMTLPLRVGVGFIPANNRDHVGVLARQQALQPLLETVQAQQFVQRAVALPHGALTASGGFRELDKIAFLHRLDAVVLVAYEQVAYTEDSPLSVLDLTLVGAFVVPGHHNDVQTRLTATAVHIPSRRYLFSADSSYQSEQTATLVHAPTQIRNAQEQGLLIAAQNLEPALQDALRDFKSGLADDASFAVKGGSVSLPVLVSVLLLLGLAWRRRS